MAIQNPVLDCIHKRRSTRQFTAEQVGEEQLDALLDAAVWAPSGSNSQSWLFTALQDRQALARLNSLVCRAYRHWQPDDDYPAKHAAKKQSQREGWSFYYDAPTLIITSNVPNYGNAMADCALALQNIFLAAESLGLGSCYINHLHWLQNDEGVRAHLCELGIPESHVICGSAAVGHAGRQSPAPTRRAGATRIVRSVK